MRDAIRERWIMLLGPAALAIAVLGLVTMPRTFYDGFVWKYFWGPVVADATGQASVLYHGVAAEPGYSFVSITVYAILLVYGVYLFKAAFDRLDIPVNDELVVSLVPFMVFGGLLRVVEDAGIVSFPWNALIISPVIYMVLAALGLLLLVTSSELADRGLFTTYHRPLRLTGALAGLATFLALLTPNLRPASVPLLLGVPAVSIGAALGVQRLLSRYRPGTYLNSLVGGIAVAGQTLDGAVTAVIVMFLGGAEKLPLSNALIEFTHPFFFPAVKAGIALAFLALLEKEEADRLTALMLLVLIAVGLGPGTRNLFRALLFGG